MDTEKNKLIERNMVLAKALEEIVDLALALAQQSTLSWQTQAKILLISEAATEALEANRE